jgi:RNA polymerase sigma factor (sigma-70 family)
MTAANANPVLRHLRRLVAGAVAALPDRDLLCRYLERRDEAAFAALVERHGPLVLGVCRAVLRHTQDAEDAFQATFLVLARKAAAIHKGDSLAGWLHRVASRIAHKARAGAGRRQAVEAKAASSTEGRQAGPDHTAPVDDLSWGEVRAVLHAELAALPERFRTPLVLCYLQGLTQEEAARRLGWTTATVKGRLHRGRLRLRGRLERRGLGLAALAAVALTEAAPAAPVPPALAAAAVRAALPVADKAVPAAAAALAESMGGSAAPALLWRTAAVLLLASVLAGGAALLGGRPAEDKTPPVPEASRPPEAPADRFGDALPDGAVARLGTVRFNHGDGLKNVRFSRDGKTIFSLGGLLRSWDAETGKELGQAAWGEPSWDDQVVVTPDGKTLVAVGQEFAGDTLRVWDIAGRKESRTVVLPVKRSELSVDRRNALSPDGRLAVLHTPDRVHVFDLETAKELYRLPKGGKEVRAVACAGNDLVVSANGDQTIEVWDARTGKPVRQFKHGAPAQVLAASPDGRLLATLEHHVHAIDKFLDRDVIHVWDLTRGVEKHQLPARPKRWYMNLLFAPDGKRLLSWVSGEGYELTIWDAETGERLHELSDAVGQHLAISPDGTRLAAGSNWGKFSLLDAKAGRLLSPEVTQDLQTAAVWLSPRGDRVLTTGYASIGTWEVATSRRLGLIELPGRWSVDPHHVHSPDGRYALSLTREDDRDETQLLVWDVGAGKRLHALRFPGMWTQLTTAFAPDSSQLAVCQLGEKPLVRFWDLRTGKETHSFPDKKAGWPGHLFFTPDGKTLIVAGRRTVGYDAATGKEQFSWRLEPLPDKSGIREAAVGSEPADPQDRCPWRRLAVSPDGTTVACILDGGFSRDPVPDRITLCDAVTGRVLRRWSDSGKPSNGYEELSFSPDGRLLATSDGQVVHLWEVATARKLRTFTGHRGEIRSLAFSGNGRRLASASNDSTVLVWDLPLALGQPGEKEVAGWWADLAELDAVRAYTAVWRLAEAPEAAVPFLRERLKPVTEAEVKDVRRHIADLDSDTFAVRKKAFEQLERLGPAAGPALRQSLEKGASPEVRRRAEELLDRLSTRSLSPESLRALRALAVLEYADTPEARRLLQELAAGAAAAWLTHQAQGSAGRLTRQSPPK